jgi:hypothetical protein
MLDPRLKPFVLCPHLLVINKVRRLLKNMTQNLCFFIFLMCHYHLHPLVEYERGIVDQKVEEDNSLDVFEMITRYVS